MDKEGSSQEPQLITLQEVMDARSIASDPSAIDKLFPRQRSRTLALYQRKRRRSQSGYRGVRTSPGRMWSMTIRFKGKTITKHGFKTAEEAAKEYDQLARLIYGSDAIVNFSHGAKK